MYVSMNILWIINLAHQLLLGILLRICRYMRLWNWQLLGILMRRVGKWGLTKEKPLIIGF